MDFLTEPAAIRAMRYLRLRARPELAAQSDGTGCRFESRDELRPPCDAGLTAPGGRGGRRLKGNLAAERRTQGA